MQDYITWKGQTTVIDVDITTTGVGKMEPGKTTYSNNLNIQTPGYQPNSKEVDIKGTVTVYQLKIQKN